MLIGTLSVDKELILLELGTQNFLWDKSQDPYQAAKDKADAAFEFITKMGFDYFCFHDFDLIQEGDKFVRI